MRKYVLDADALVLVSVKIAQNAQLVAIIKNYKSIKKLIHINVFYGIVRSSIRTFLYLIRTSSHNPCKYNRVQLVRERTNLTLKLLLEQVFGYLSYNNYSPELNDLLEE